MDMVFSSKKKKKKRQEFRAEILKVFINFNIGKHRGIVFETLLLKSCCYRQKKFENVPPSLKSLKKFSQSYNFFSID